MSLHEKYGQDIEINKIDDSNIIVERVKTYDNEQPLGMAWYKFLVYFGLIAGAVVSIIYSLGYISGGIYLAETNGQVTAEQVYAFYGKELQILDISYGVFMLAFATLAFVVRHKLVKYNPLAINLVIVFFSLQATVPFLYNIFAFAITNQAFDIQAFCMLIGGLSALVLNTVYFKKRSHLFVGKDGLTKLYVYAQEQQEHKNAETRDFIKLKAMQESSVEYCWKCGTRLHEESLFCHKCGLEIIQKKAEDEPKKQTIATTKKSKKKPIIIGTITFLIVAIITALIIFLLGNSNKDEKPYNVGVRAVSFEDKFTAEFVLATWKLGEQTELTMIEIMDEYASKQGGGKLYIINPGDFVQEVDEWCFSSERKTGDCAIIENVYGYTLCYFSGRNIESSEQHQSKSKHLIVAVEPDFVPYSWEENGEFFGLHIDIANEIARRNGFTVEFVSASWDDLFVGIKNGTYNIVFGIEPNAIREEELRNTEASFTSVYYNEMAAIVNIAEFELSFVDWSNFKYSIKNMVEDGTIASYVLKYEAFLNP